MYSSIALLSYTSIKDKKSASALISCTNSLALLAISSE